MIPVSLWGPALAGLLIASTASPARAAGGAWQPVGAAASRSTEGSAHMPGAARPPLGAPWWAIYRDAGLDALMDRLHGANATLAQARARLAIARADARLAGAEAAPRVELGGSANHAAGPLVNAAGQSGDLFTLRAAATWELDVLGRRADERRAARAETGAAEAELADVTLLLEAGLARAWFTRAAAARAADEARLAEGALRELAAIAQRRREAGLIPLAELDAARTRAVAGEARRRALERLRDSAARQLTGLVDGAEDGLAGPVPGLPELPEIPAALPADLLARRPDLRAARARVVAADARLAALRKGWLPPIPLTATEGRASSSLAGLFSAAGGVFGLGALLALPVFDGGRQRARVARGEAETALAEAAYRERAALALRDVHDSLQAAQDARAARAAAHDQALAGADLLARAEVRATGGTISRAELLAAQVAAHERRAAASLAEGEGLAALIALQGALGGGWDD